MILLPLPLRCHCWSWDVQVFLGWETLSLNRWCFCIQGKQADFHQRCECVITKTYATVNARTKSMLYFTSYQTYRKTQNHVVCRSFCSCESVGIWSKNGDCTARFGVFQVFIIEECCRFLHARRYWMALSIWINVFARLWYMCPNFSTSKWWHSWQIIWPSIGRILLRKAGCLTLHLESCRDVFPFWINLIGIRVYQLIFASRVDVFFDPL